MKKYRIVLLAPVVLVMFLGGCVSFRFAPTGYKYEHSNRTADQMDLFYGGKVPEKPYIAVGYLATSDVWFCSSARCKKVLKRKAAALGLDGVYQIYIGEQSFIGKPGWFIGAHTGKGFIYQK